MREFLLSVGYDRWILPALLALPLVGAVLVLLGRHAPEGEDEVASGLARRAAVIATAVFAVEFVLSLGLWWAFDPALSGWQQRVDVAWIPSWGARFTVGLDGVALMMVLLTTFIMLLASFGSATSIRRKTAAYYALLLVLTTGMLGVFVSLDLFLFYAMWEVMLVPMYFIIGIWGGRRRIYASLKFFIYTMIGSLLMLVGIVYLGLAAQAPGTGVPNFSYDAIMATARIAPSDAYWLFGAFFLAFAVKVPMFPFHTWLPDAHVEAPTAGSVVLASIMLKLGTFGFIRLAVPLFPGAAMDPTVRGIILALAVIGIVYGALVSLVQPDFKKLVAYSSVSHLGFVMLGIFALTVQSVQGALMVMISHGLSTGALFFLIGMIYERRHTRLIEDYGGIARVVPMFAAVLTFVSLSSIGLPGTNGFIGEFLVLLGTFRTFPVLALVAATSVIIAAAYLLWAIQRILFNALDKPVNEHVPDLSGRELALMIPLVAGILWLGVYPAPVLRRMQPAAERFVRLVETRAAMSTAAVSAAQGGRGCATTTWPFLRTSPQRSFPTSCSWRGR
jgi:NADH-quinone oxidoreductase subunit M